VFTRALHWSLPSARSIQSTSPHSISLRSILILSTHLLLGLPSSLRFYTKKTIFLSWGKKRDQIWRARWNVVVW
jgi:hypothetical protein